MELPYKFGPLSFLRQCYTFGHLTLSRPVNSAVYHKDFAVIYQKIISSLILLSLIYNTCM
jgi:hypothetical protein